MSKRAANITISSRYRNSPLSFAAICSKMLFVALFVSSDIIASAFRPKKVPLLAQYFEMSRNFNFLSIISILKSQLPNLPSFRKYCFAHTKTLDFRGRNQHQPIRWIFYQGIARINEARRVPRGLTSLVSFQRGLRPL